MIARLRGVAAHTETNALIIDVQGVGYRVFVTNETIQAATSAGVVSLWTYLAVRENALELYGFLHESEIQLFTMLLSVSGIGPKSALAILNLASVTVLQQAIASGDSSYLTQVAGIGKKNAQKIVLELRDKLTLTGTVAENDKLPDTDAMAALTTLGYSATEAREALKALPDDGASAGERVKAALRELNRSK